MLEEENSIIYSPQQLWKDFDCSLPLCENVVNEQIYENLTIRDIRILGRETGKGRVSIFACYAFSNIPPKKKTKKSALLILSDCKDTIDKDMVSHYVRQGYNVLMVDYRGQSEDVENFTIYPNNISYANYYKCGRAMDYCDLTAFETSWYEWVAVAKYGLTFLKNQDNVEKIGVIGIKEGSNVGWMLCGSDDRVDSFVSLFGAGWRAYKKDYKYRNSDDLVLDKERIRFLAGVESQAYAQNVKCPVLYMTATNSPDFDIDRSVDTLIRVPETLNFEMERYNCYAPRHRDVLDKQCYRNIEIFLAKTLLDFKITFPAEPILDVEVNGEDVTVNAQISFSDTKRYKKVELYIAEGGEAPSFRDWNLMYEIKNTKSEIEKKFRYKLTSRASFISVFALVEYKNGITICSKIHTKKVIPLESKYNKLLYSSKDHTSSFAVYDVKKYSLFGLFFNDSDYLFTTEGASGISGICSKYGLVTYRVNNTYLNINENSLVKMDAYCMENACVDIILMTYKNMQSEEYFYKVNLPGANIWQSLLIKTSDFKSVTGGVIQDFSNVYALRIESKTLCLVNNILLI